ncbi:MAG: hypothetical protein WCE44_11300 [Candidatus Velthaea sp.]
MLNTTTDLVRSYLDLPREAKIDQFIVKDTSDPMVLAQQYTLTSAIRPRLELLLRDIKDSLDRNLDVGRFVFGSFGSGKSHFLRIVGMMLANEERLYANARDAGIREVHSANPWLDTAHILAIHTSMMGVQEAPDAFIRHLASEFDRTLESIGREPLRAFGTEAAFTQFEKQCETVPGYFLAFSDKLGYDRATYDKLRAKPEEDKDRIAFARVVATFVAGSETAFQPTNAEARKQMASHAKSLGFKAIAFTIDEFVLWAQGISGGNYAAAVNALNALVESADVRAVPFIVLAAVQRSIMSVFPDDRTENVLREHLRHVSARFPEIILEDSNLFEIAEKRVLAPIPERAKEWRAEVARVSRALGDGVKGVLVGELPATVLEQLYPFHPALLRILSDVTQGLQRERSSLFMLYQLLTTVRPNLKVGDLMSLGALWEVLFSEEQIDGLEAYAARTDSSNAANRLLKTYSTWDRLRDSIRRESGGGDVERVLDLAVKSVLLMQLSHTPFLDDIRGLDQAASVENLYRLNRNELAVRTETMGVLRILELLKKLTTAEPGTVSLRGDGPVATVHIELNTVDLTGLMEGLRPTAGDRFGCLLSASRDALGVSSAVTSGQEGRYRVTWRNSERTGRIRFESFNQFSASGRAATLALESGDDYKLGILLESDTNGGVQEAIDNARARVESAREQTQAWAAAWIPTPLSTEGRAALEQLAKFEVFRRDPDVHLSGFKASDHPFVRQRLDAMAAQAQATLAEAITRAYGDGSRLITMRKDPAELTAPANVPVSQRARAFVTALLERRYPQYPKFGRTPNPVALNRILAIYRQLLDDATQNAFAGDDLDVIEKIGEPLELFDPGFGVTNARATGLYLGRLKEWFDAGERSVRSLIDHCATEPWGLPQNVAQLLIAVLAVREGLRLTVDGASVPIEAVSEVNVRGTLTKGQLPPLAEWNAARNAASTLLQVRDIPASHTVASVDSLVIMLREPIDALIEKLHRCVTAFAKLRAKNAYTGAIACAERYEAAYREMLALRDASKLISRLAGLDLETYLPVVQSAANDADALDRLVDFAYLDAVIQGSEELRVHLERLLTDDVVSVAPQIQSWRTSADKWIEGALLHRPPTPPSPPLPPKGHDVVRSVRVSRWSGDLDALLGNVRGALTEALAEASAENASIDVEIRVRGNGAEKA